MTREISPSALRARVVAHPIELPRLSEEIALMERAIAIHDRHAELRSEMARRGMTLIEAATSRGDITKLVAAHFSLTAEQLRGRDQRRMLSLPRGVLAFALHERRLQNGDRRWPLSAVGWWMGERDHTSALFLIRKAQRVFDQALREQGWRA